VHANVPRRASRSVSRSRKRLSVVTRTSVRAALGRFARPGSVSPRQVLPLPADAAVFPHGDREHHRVSQLCPLSHPSPWRQLATYRFALPGSDDSTLAPPDRRIVCHPALGRLPTSLRLIPLRRPWPLTAGWSTPRSPGYILGVSHPKLPWILDFAYRSGAAALVAQVRCNPSVVDTAVAVNRSAESRHIQTLCAFEDLVPAALVALTLRLG